jgi:hypothetical protein
MRYQRNFVAAMASAILTVASTAAPGALPDRLPYFGDQEWDILWQHQPDEIGQ